MLVDNNMIWLIRHTYVPGWHLPGGGLHKWETLDQAARREAHEETGADLGEMTLLGAFTSFLHWKTDHNVTFLCQDFRFSGKTDGEIAELHAFPLNNLPETMHEPHRHVVEAFAKGELHQNFGQW